jgi:hypothetical protein
MTKFRTPQRGCLTEGGGVCSSRSSKEFRSLEAIVQDYIDRRRGHASCELGYFGGQKSLVEAIRVAALAINCNGKRHPHQRRIPKEHLEHYRRGLTRKSESLKSCKSFHKLMEISQSIADDIWKHSELTVYDTTQRIGAYLKRYPDRVYLHAGTRKGARALVKFRRGVPYLFPKELPGVFRRLKPYEVEDCLCIYKGALKSLHHLDW